MVGALDPFRRVPPHVARAIAAALALRVLVDGCAWLLRAS